MRIYSWNVNGIRACVRKGFAPWLATCGGTIIGMQEVRAAPEQIPPEAASPSGWHVHFVAAQKPGYSGVGLLSRRLPDEIEISLGPAKYDVEARLQIARFGRLTVANVYVPNGSGPNRDLSRIPYKLAFQRLLFRRLQPHLENGERLLVMGDFNTAHQEIDLARPKANEKNSGFRPEERRALGRLLARDWIDTFRHFVTDGGHYSWWSQHSGARERNVGWRIDYILASPAAMEFVRGATIHRHVTASDHCPISVEVDDAIFD